jgi:uncharacterized cupin superfamily protein
LLASKGGYAVSAISHPTVVAPGGGHLVDLGLGRPTIKLGPRDRTTQIGLVEGELPPGGGFRVPHWHDDLDEVFYVLEGEIEFLIDDRWTCGSAGTTVFIPAGTVHAFRNPTNRPARQLVIGAPEVAALISDLGEHPPEDWEAVHEHYRSHYAKDHPAPAPD